MNFHQELEVRPDPECIPTVELLLPLPSVWVEALQRTRRSVPSLLFTGVTGLQWLPKTRGDRLTLRGDCMEVFWGEWRRNLAKWQISPAMPRYVMIMRQDVLNCLQEAATRTGVTMHEIILGILALTVEENLLPSELECLEKRDLHFSRSGGEIIQGPWQTPNKNTKKREVSISINLSKEEYANVVRYHSKAYECAPGYTVSEFAATTLRWWFGKHNLPARRGFPKGSRIESGEGKGAACNRRIKIRLSGELHKQYTEQMRSGYECAEGFTLSDLAKLALITFSSPKAERVMAGNQ